MLPSFRTIIIAFWAPAFAGLAATTATWLVWYYTTMPCTPENAADLMCRPGPLARYVSATVLNHCIIHAGIAVTITGGSDIMLFLRERQRNQQERQRNEQERERGDRMLELLKEAIDQAAEERRQSEARAAEERRQAEARVAEERRQAEARVAEERRQAALERQAFLEALNRLTEAISQNGHDRH